MVWIYFDASALVKRYSNETGSTLLIQLFQQLHVGHMTILSIGVLEIISILVRKRNDGRLTKALYDEAIIGVTEEIIDNEQFTITKIDDDLVFSSIDYISQHNINATDAIILQSCLRLQKNLPQNDQIILWSSDKRLIRAAQNSGLEVFDPEIGSSSELQSSLIS